MVGLIGLLVVLILLLVFLTLPLSDWRALWQWLKERVGRIRAGPALSALGQLLVSKAQLHPGKSPSPRGERLPYQEVGRRVARRMARAQGAVPGPSPRPSPAKGAPAAMAREAPAVRWPFLALLLFVLLAGLTLSLYPLLAPRPATERRHHLVILVAAGRETAEGEKLRQALRPFLDASGLTHTVSLRTVPRPSDADAAYAQTAAQGADLFLWGVPLTAEGRYALTLTVRPRPDPERPEMGEYLQVMMTPPCFPLTGERGLTAEEVAPALAWLAHFYLGEWAEAYRPEKVPPESPVSEVLDFHQAALLFLRGDYSGASRLYADLSGEYSPFLYRVGIGLEPEPTLPPAVPTRPSALRAAALNNLAVARLQEAEAWGNFSSEEAISLLEQAAQLAPDAPVILYNLGRAYLGRHEWTRAREALEKALQGRPNDALTLARLGQACCGAGDATCTRDRAQQALEANPNLAEAHLALACYYLGMADPDRAGREVDRALHLAEEESKRRRAQEIALRSVPVPHLPWAAYQAAWTARSLPLLARSRLAQAKRYLVQFYSQPPPGFGEYLWTLVFGGESPLDQAWKELDRAGEVLPEGYEALCLRGEVALARGQMEEAVRFFQQAQEEDPFDREAYLRLAEVYLRRWHSFQAAGRQDEAEESWAQADELYRRLIEQDIAPIQGHLGLGKMAQEAGRDEEALQEYRRAAELDPNCAEAYLRMGLVERQQGQEAEALDHFTLATGKVARDEVLLAAEVGKGSLLLERYLGSEPSLRSREWLNQARTAFQRAAELPKKGFRYDTSGVAVRPAVSFGTDDDLRALCGLGRVAYEEGNYPEAERRFQEALEKNRDFFEALYGLGRVYLAQKERVEKALEYLQRAVERSPESIAAHYYLGEAYAAQLQENRARRIFEKVAQLCQEGKAVRADDRRACQEVARRLPGPR
ncbi:MAG: tetratricopeptide repeat protein [Chloroflexia bacterium]